jgi:hypothetical protein
VFGFAFSLIFGGETRVGEISVCFRRFSLTPKPENAKNQPDVENARRKIFLDSGAETKRPIDGRTACALAF